MVWPYLMGFSALTLAACSASGRGHSISVSAYILAAYVAMIPAKQFPINGDVPLVLFAAIWVLASGAIWRHTTTMAGNSGVSPFVPAAIGLIGICYFVARLYDMEPKFMSPPFVASDLLAVFAMLCIWWGIRADLVSRMGDMADRGRSVVYDIHSRTGGRGDIAYLSGKVAKQKGEIE